MLPITVLLVTPSSATPLMFPSTSLLTTEHPVTSSSTTPAFSSGLVPELCTVNDLSITLSAITATTEPVAPPSIILFVPEPVTARPSLSIIIRSLYVPSATLTVSPAEDASIASWIAPLSVTFQTLPAPSVQSVTVTGCASKVTSPSTV